MDYHHHTIGTMASWRFRGKSFFRLSEDWQLGTRSGRDRHHPPDLKAAWSDLILILAIFN